MTAEKYKEAEKERIDKYLESLINNDVKLNLSLADNKRSFNFEIKSSYLMSLRMAGNFGSMAAVVDMLLSELAKKELETVNPDKNES